MAKLKRNTQALKAARCESGLAKSVFSIDGVLNLYLVVSKTGSKTWLVRHEHRHGGKRATKATTIGHFEKAGLADGELMSLVEAQKTRDELISAARNTASVYDPKAGKLPTFLAMAQRVFEIETVEGAPHELSRRPGPSTLYNHWLNLAAPNGPFDRFGHKRLNEVTTDDVIAICKAKFKETQGVGANRIQSSISFVFKQAERELGRSIDNPATSAPRFGKEKPRHRVVQPYELRKIWSAFDAEDADANLRLTAMSWPVRQIARLMILLGQRGDEICSLRHDEISDLDSDKPVVLKQHTKNKHPQILPLPPMAALILREVAKRAQNEVYLFPARGDADRRPHINRESISRAMARTRTMLGIEDVVMHDMRRAMSTYMGERGVDIEVLRRLLNHRPKGVTGKNYEHSIRLNAMRTALEQWQRVFCAMVSGEIETYEDVETWVDRDAAPDASDNDGPASDDILDQIAADPAMRDKLLKRLLSA